MNLLQGTFYAMPATTLYLWEYAGELRFAYSVALEKEGQAR